MQIAPKAPPAHVPPGGSRSHPPLIRSSIMPETATPPLKAVEHLAALAAAFQVGRVGGCLTPLPLAFRISGSARRRFPYVLPTPGADLPTNRSLGKETALGGFRRIAEASEPQNEPLDRVFPPLSHKYGNIARRRVRLGLRHAPRSPRGRASDRATGECR